jgi:hypothetical protein
MAVPVLNANGLTPTAIVTGVRTHFKVTGQNLGDDSIRGSHGSIVLRTLNPATGICWDPVQSLDIDDQVPNDLHNLYFWATCHNCLAAGPLQMTNAGNVQVTVTNGSGTAQRTYLVAYSTPPPPPPISPTAGVALAGAQPHIGITQTVFSRGVSNPFAIYGDNMDDVDTNQGTGSIEIIDDFGNRWTDLEAKGVGNNRVKIKGTPPEAPEDGSEGDGGPSNTQVTVTNGAGQPAVLNFPATYI